MTCPPILHALCEVDNIPHIYFSLLPLEADHRVLLNTFLQLSRGYRPSDLSRLSRHGAVDPQFAPSHCRRWSHWPPIWHSSVCYRISTISEVRSWYGTISLLARGCLSLSLSRPWPPIWIHSPAADTSHVAFCWRALPETFVRGRWLEILTLSLIRV